MKTVTRPMQDRDVILDAETVREYIVIRDASGLMLNWHGPVFSDADRHRIVSMVGYTLKYHAPDGATYASEFATEVDIYDESHR